MPAPIRSILVPLDGSALAEAVIPLVTDLARSCGASVTLARVVPFPGGVYFGSPYVPLVSPNTFDRAVEEARAAARAYLLSVAERLGAAGVAVETIVHDGEPASRLLSLMNVERYDLIVAATHGRTGVKRWILGSVAERLIEASHTPVLLVRSSASATSESSEAVAVGVGRDAASTPR